MKVKFSDLLSILEETNEIDYSNSILNLYEEQVVFSIDHTLIKIQELIALCPNNKGLKVFHSAFEDKTSVFLFNKSRLNGVFTYGERMLSLYKEIVEKNDFEIDLKSIPEAILPFFSLAEKAISPLSSGSNTFFNVFCAYFKKKEVLSVLEDLVHVFQKSAQEKIDIPIALTPLYLKSVESLSKKQKSVDEKLDVLSVAFKTDIQGKTLLLKILNAVSDVIGENKENEIIEFVKISPFYHESPKYKEVIDGFIDGILKRQITEDDLYNEDPPDNYSFSSGVRNYQEVFNFSDSRIEERFKVGKGDLLMISKSLPYVFKDFLKKNNCSYEINMERGFRCIVNFESLEKVVEFKPKLDLFLMGIDNFVVPEMINELKINKSDIYPKNLKGIEALTEYGVKKCQEFEERRYAIKRKNAVLEIFSAGNNDSAVVDTSEFKL